MDLTIIDSPSSLSVVCSRLAQKPVIGFDIETTDLDPHFGQIRLVQLSDGDSTYVLDMRPIYNATGMDMKTSTFLQPLRDLLTDSNVIKAVHNAKFDCKWVRYHLGVETASVFCTMLNSQILACGLPDRAHNLAAVAKYFLGITVDKSEQTSDWSAPNLERSQIEYAAKDATILPELYHEQLRQLTNLGLLEVSRLENECVAAVVDMELAGTFLDKDAWRAQLAAVRADQTVLEDELQRALIDPTDQMGLFERADINLGSSAQVHEVLVNMGIPMPDSTEAWRLQALVPDYPIIGKLLEYRATDKVLTSFGENLLSFINPKTGRIHPEFKQLGALTTGRFSASKPNSQQIPHEDEYRSCFKAEPGNKLVIADYSQIELRILADRCQDPVFVGAFNQGLDLHTATAAAVNNVPLDGVTDEMRFFAKRLNFGMVYGVGPKKFALMTGTTTEEAEATMEAYFNRFQGLNIYLRDAGRSSICMREARTASGRLLKLNFDEHDRGQVSAAKRNGVNMPIQGTSADILKRALRLVHEGNRGTSARLTNVVHDEIILECHADEAEQTARRLEHAMITAGEEYVKTVPISVDAKVSDEWRK